MGKLILFDILLIYFFPICNSFLVLLMLTINRKKRKRCATVKANLHYPYLYVYVCCAPGSRDHKSNGIA